MAEDNSYRQILRSTSIIGGASVINILVGLLRTKVAAMLLGPAGVGLIGLFTNLVGTASTVAGLGFGNVGTRQIAQASATGDEDRVVTARRALFWGTLGLSVLGAIAFWALRDVLAQRAMQDAALAGDIGWLAVAVALSVASASQNALLNGMRQIGDIARVSVGSALLSSAIGIIALWIWGRAGILAFIIAAPLASFVLGHWYVSRLPQTQGRAQVREMAKEWRVLARLGFAFMVAGLAGTAGQLVVRLLIQRDLGVEALGHFHAAWAISMTYIGFVLGAMGTDYYPRLVAVIEDPVAVNRLVNEQMEVALLLAAPVLLAMLGLAPWVIELLYSREFGEAVAVLRWQVLGDVLKIASWPVGFILLASGAGKTFMATEWTAMAVFSASTWVLLPYAGLVATGQSFLLMYMVLAIIVFWLAKRRTRFQFQPRTLKLLAFLLSAATAVMAMSSYTNMLAAAGGMVGALGFAIYALVRLTHAGTLGGPVARLGARVLTLRIRVGAGVDRFTGRRRT